MQEQQKPPFEDMRQKVSAFLALTQIISKPIQAWTRKDTGELFFGGQAVIAMIALPFFGAFVDPMDILGQQILWWFWGITMFLFVVHRVKRLQNQRKGIYVHSRSSGKRIFGWFEVPVVLAAGLVILPFSKPLGFYLLASLFGLIVSSEYERQGEAAIIRNARDARMEAEYYASQLEE